MFKKLSKSLKSDKRKVKALVEAKSFDLLIMTLICLDGVALGMLSILPADTFLSDVLFILDRLFMAIFIVEMILKLYVYGNKFFHKGWNVFDFVIISISSSAMFSYFIILRVFRLFRLLKYIDRFTRLKQIVNTFILLLPNFVAMLSVFALFLYVFSIMGVFLFGGFFVEFSSLGNASFTLLQVFTLDGWADSIARPVMRMFPYSWIFFVSFLLSSALIVISFLMNAVAEIMVAINSKKITRSRL